MKKVFVVLLICLFMFSGCTTFTLNTQEKSYTYDDLNDDQKKIIDGVFEEYSKWASVQDSGKTILCSNVTFFDEDGILIFATYYNCQPSSPAMFSKIFEVGEDGTLSSHTYDVIDVNNRKRAAMAKAASGLPFSKDDSTEKKKNTLSEAYYNAIQKSKS